MKRDVPESGARAADVLAQWVTALRGDIESVEKLVQGSKSTFGRELSFAEFQGLMGVEGLIDEGSVHYHAQSSWGSFGAKATVTDSVGRLAFVERLYVLAGLHLWDILETIEIDKRRPDGTFARLMLRSLEEFERLDGHEIRLEAIWTGLYVWPLLGFAPVEKTDEERLAAEFADWLCSRFTVTQPETRARVGKYTMRQVALARYGERRIGKDFLIQRGNAGRCVEMVLGISDESSKGYRTFRSYLEARA